jgi:hypothetical protein
MSVRSFFDSNILVYTDDTGAPEKQAQALDLLERGRIEQSGVISTQVLQEYFVTSTKKLKVAVEVARREGRAVRALQPGSDWIRRYPGGHRPPPHPPDLLLGCLDRSGGASVRVFRPVFRGLADRKKN